MLVAGESVQPIFRGYVKSRAASREAMALSFFSLGMISAMAMGAAAAPGTGTTSHPALQLLD
jgi:hypothetical protein